MVSPKFTARDMRDALSKFATGVTIVTTCDADGESIGMTASSFNSVSMEPPLILWSVTKTAYSAPVFKSADNFSVHVLAADQKEISNRFARAGEDKFNGIDHTLDVNKIPLIQGSMARFDCKTWAVYEGGDHWIIVGEVQNLISNDGEGLVFYNGAYATASAMRADQAAPTEGYSINSPIEDLLIYHMARAYRQFGDGFHDAVRQTGMSVSEWRILASIQGKVSRNFSELSHLTFIQKPLLSDMVVALQEKGLCSVEHVGSDQIVTGTKQGHERVEHLFSLAKDQEHEALAQSGSIGLEKLINLLDEVSKNTSKK